MKQILSKVQFRYVDSSKFDVDWHSTLHAHAFTELFYVVKGKGSFEFGDGSSVQVKEDDMIIINPNTTHTERSDKENLLEYIVIGIEGIEFLSDDETVGYSLHNYLEYKHDILFYLRSIANEVGHSDTFNELIVDYLLKILIMNVIRRTVSELRLYEGDPNINKDCLFIENYINTHYRENITLDRLADLTFLNKYYLSHEFKKYSGQSPIEYLLNKRLKESKKLLATTDIGISQMSSIIGFSNSSYFSQYFKKNVGCSPSEYRKEQKKQS